MADKGSGFLERLDSRLAAGWKTLGKDLRKGLLEALGPFAGPRGGYRGREGPEDPYYTDFAVRLLDLAGASRVEFERAAAYLESLPPPEDLVPLFCRMNAGRLLRRRGLTVRDPDGLDEVLDRQRAVAGGFAHPGRRECSAYMTFLAALASEMSGRPFPEAGRAIQALRALRRPGGGFGELPGEGPPQANATAAALAALGILGAPPRPEAAEDVSFLRNLQAPDGGLRAHPETPVADLLSTYSVLVCLSELGAANRLNLAAAARFVLDRRAPSGGFSAFPGDPGQDPEYTYYGAACLCLLQAYLDSRGSS